MLFPELGPQYYNEPHRGLLSRMEAAYAESITINQSFWGEADTDLRFFTGDQTLWNDLYGGNLQANRRRQFNFNRIMRVINMITGHQRRNRKSTIVIPFENGDSHTADQFTKVMMWIAKQNGMLETISDAFQSSCIGGMSFLSVWMDYREDPISGNIKVDNCPYNYFLVDPFFKKSDMSDCNFFWKRSFLTKREIISLLPDRSEEILGLMGRDPGSSRDGKFQYTPESYSYSMNDLLTYDEYYYRDFRTQQMLVDRKTGETMEWKGKDNDKLREFLRVYPQVTVIENEIPTTKLALVVQGRVFYEGPNPMGIDQYPVVPVFAYYHPELAYYPWRIQGVVRGLRDAQYLYNRRRVIELDILESQINSGFKYKENALVNPKDIFLTGQGRGLAIKEEAQMTDVEQIVAPAIPASMIQLSELLAKEVSEISGVNEELLGFDEGNQKAGILSMLRQGAGLTTLQGLFDNLDNAQKQLGKIIIDLVQANYTPGKIQKILEGEQPAPLFYNKAFGKYHAAVEEGLNTISQKQMQFAQMLQMREQGVPIPDESLLDASTLQNKTELIKKLEEQKQQAQQVQQQQMQTQMQLQQAQAELAQARAVADRGLGLERASRVQENQALAIERKAAAEKDKDQAFLNLVRAIKEIDGMDLNHIEQLIGIASQVKAQEQINAESSTINSQSLANQATNQQSVATT